MTEMSFTVVKDSLLHNRYNYHELLETNVYAKVTSAVIAIPPTKNRPICYLLVSNNVKCDVFYIFL